MKVIYKNWPSYVRPLYVRLPNRVDLAWGSKQMLTDAIALFVAARIVRRLFPGDRITVAALVRMGTSIAWDAE